MKEILKIGNLNFSQKSAINCGLKINHLLIVSYINDFIASGNCEKEQLNGESYFYIAYQKLLTDLPIFDVGKKQIINLITDLISCNVLTPLNRTVGRKKTFYKLNLKLIPNAKSIEPTKQLCVIDASAKSPELEFYLNWFREKIKDYAEKIDQDKFEDSEINTVKKRFANFIEKMSLKQFYTILGQQISTTHILLVLQDFFKQKNYNITTKLISECYAFIDSRKDIKNKFNYAISLFYNMAIDNPGLVKIKKTIANFDEREYTKKELEGLFNSLENLDI